MSEIDSNTLVADDFAEGEQQQTMNEDQLRDFFLSHHAYFTLLLYRRFAFSDMTEDDIDEILQEVALRLFCGPDRKIQLLTYKTEAQYLGWLTQTIFNVFASIYKTEKRKVVSKYAHPLMLIEDDPYTVDRVFNNDFVELTRDKIMCSKTEEPYVILIQREQAELIRERITNTLSPQQLEVFSMKFFGGMQHPEIAELLGENVHTVASRIFASVKLIKETGCLADLVS